MRQQQGRVGCCCPCGATSSGFLIRLATERSGASQRNHMLHLRRQLVEHGAHMTIEQFNGIDRRIDQLFLSAAHEPFVESTLRPLHTIFRRIGWIYHMQTAYHAKLQATIDGHVAVIDAVANGHVDAAIAASDGLMDFVESMFDVLEREVAPALLDCSLESFDDTFLGSAREGLRGGQPILNVNDAA